MKKQILPGDIVRVNFNNVMTNLCQRAEVISRPQATGESWIFEDLETGEIHYVSEGCTITKLNPES